MKYHATVKMKGSYPHRFISETYMSGQRKCNAYVTIDFVSTGKEYWKPDLGQSFLQGGIKYESEKWGQAKTYKAFNIFREILLLTLEGECIKYFYMYFLT